MKGVSRLWKRVDTLGPSSVYGAGFSKRSNYYRRKNWRENVRNNFTNDLAQEDEIGVFQICVPKELVIFNS